MNRNFFLLLWFFLFTACGTESALQSGATGNPRAQQIQVTPVAEIPASFALQVNPPLQKEVVGGREGWVSILQPGVEFNFTMRTERCAGMDTATWSANTLVGLGREGGPYDNYLVLAPGVFIYSFELYPNAPAIPGVEDIQFTTIFGRATREYLQARGLGDTSVGFRLANCAGESVEFTLRFP